MKHIITFNIALLLMSAPSLAQDGSLDPSFGKAGIVSTRIGLGNNYCKAVVVQEDDKIVVAGNTQNDVALIRYHSNGSLDTSFGTGGVVTTSISGGGDVTNGIAIQSDGKFVLVGYSGIFPNYDVLLVRYSEDGALDESFGTGGTVLTNIGAKGDQGHAVAIQSDGKIVVAGNYDNGTNSDIVLVRYTENGKLDSSFHNDGIVTTGVGPAGEIARSVAVQSDGKILITGYSYTPKSFAYEFVIVRYAMDGSLDSSFGINGIVTTDIVSQNDYGESIVVLNNGKIIVGGYSFSGNLSVAQYDSSGRLDPLFGVDGKVTLPFGCMYQNDYSIAMQTNGKILLCGYSTLRSANSDFAMARFTDRGLLDPTFGVGGVITTPIGIADDVATAVAIQKDGKIILAGTSFDGTSNVITVVRYRIPTTDVVESSVASDIAVYPNPFSTQTTFHSVRGFIQATLALFNSIGECVYSERNISGTSFTMNCQDLARGVYYARMIQPETSGATMEWTQTLIHTAP
ncbi:MAG: hypothetical protein H7X70_01430 [Candidatus Kapabacteria bacterium]|nr:hypothetical protein [Candidatus Kapabacteria bacterium]